MIFDTFIHWNYDGLWTSLSFLIIQILEISSVSAILRLVDLHINYAAIFMVIIMLMLSYIVFREHYKSTKPRDTFIACMDTIQNQKIVQFLRTVPDYRPPWWYNSHLGMLCYIFPPVLSDMNHRINYCLWTLSKFEVRTTALHLRRSSLRRRLVSLQTSRHDNSINIFY